MLTGHGPYKSYLHRFRRSETDVCEDCGENDDAWCLAPHILQQGARRHSKWAAYQGNRSRTTSVMLATLIRSTTTFVALKAAHTKTSLRRQKEPTKGKDQNDHQNHEVHTIFEETPQTIIKHYNLKPGTAKTKWANTTGHGMEPGTSGPVTILTAPRGRGAHQWLAPVIVTRHQTNIKSGGWKRVGSGFEHTNEARKWNKVHKTN